MKWMEAAGRKTVLIIAFFMLFLCWSMTMFGTVYVDIKEHIHYLGRSGLISYGFLIVVSGLLFALRKRIAKVELSDQWMRLFTIVYAVILVFLVLILRVEPGADQESVLKSAGQMLYGQSATWSDVDGYMHIWPNQNGIVLFFAICSKVFGMYNYVAIQLINVAALVVSNIYLAKSFHVLFENEKLAKVSYIAISLFLPMNLYVTFIYGTLIGLCAVSVGFFHLLQFQKSESWKNAVATIVFLGIACCLKQNYLICLLAGVLVLLFHGLFQKKIKQVLVAVLIVMVCFGMGRAVDGIIAKTMDVEISSGIPASTWVTMGLQEGYLGPGWWNRYSIQVYQQAEGDENKVREIVKNDLLNRIGELKNDKKYALNFFGRKIASMWNEASFESFWINTVRTRSVNWEDWLVGVMYDGGAVNTGILWIEHLALMMIYFGALLYVLPGNRTMRENLFLICFIGGFLFHLFWEAKGQYTIVYVYFLIPYAIQGYYQMMKKIESVSLSFEQGREKKVAILLCGIVLIVLTATNNRISANCIKLSGDEKAYQEYLEHHWDGFRSGIYKIYVDESREISLVSLLDQERAIDSDRFMITNHVVSVAAVGYYEAYDRKRDLNLAVDEKKEAVLGDDAGTWYFFKVDDFSYIIANEEGEALTYDSKTNRLSLEKQTGADNQRWYLEKVRE